MIAASPPSDFLATPLADVDSLHITSPLLSPLIIYPPPLTTCFFSTAAVSQTSPTTSLNLSSDGTFSDPLSLFSPSSDTFDIKASLFGNYPDSIFKVYSYADFENTFSLLNNKEFVTTAERGHHRRTAHSGTWPEGSDSSVYAHRGRRDQLSVDRHSVPRSTLGFQAYPYGQQQFSLPPTSFGPTSGHDVSEDMHAEPTFSYHSPPTGQPPFVNSPTYYSSGSSSYYPYTTFHEPTSQSSSSYNTSNQPPSLSWDLTPSSHGVPSPSLPSTASYHTPTVRATGDTFTPDYEYQRMHFTPSTPTHYFTHGAPSMGTSSLGLALSPPPNPQPLYTPTLPAHNVDDQRPSKRMRPVLEHEEEPREVPRTSQPLPINQPVQVMIPAATDETETEMIQRRGKGRERRQRVRTSSGRVSSRRPRPQRQESLGGATSASVLPRSSSPQSPALPTPTAAPEYSHLQQFPSDVGMIQSAPAAVRHFPTTMKSPLSEGRSLLGGRPSPLRQDEEMREQVVDFRPQPAFEHGPSELPPRPYPGGPNAISPWVRPKPRGKIPGSAMDYLPVLEARFNRLERAINGYVEYRGRNALTNSMLPGLSFDSQLPGDSHPQQLQYPAYE